MVLYTDSAVALAGEAAFLHSSERLLLLSSQGAARAQCTPTQDNTAAPDNASAWPSAGKTLLLLTKEL